MSEKTNQVIINLIYNFICEIEDQKKKEFIVHLKNTAGTEKIISHVEECGIPEYLIIAPEIYPSIQTDNLLHKYLKIVSSIHADPLSLVFYWPSINKFLIQKLK